LLITGYTSTLQVSKVDLSKNTVIWLSLKSIYIWKGYSKHANGNCWNTL